MLTAKESSDDSRVRRLRLAIAVDEITSTRCSEGFVGHESKMEETPLLEVTASCVPE